VRIRPYFTSHFGGFDTLTIAGVLYSAQQKTQPGLRSAGELLYVFDRRKTKTRENRSVVLISILLISG
jgi:hypothetical protein